MDATVATQNLDGTQTGHGQHHAPAVPVSEGGLHCVRSSISKVLWSSEGSLYAARVKTASSVERKSGFSSATRLRRRARRASGARRNKAFRDVRQCCRVVRVERVSNASASSLASAVRAINHVAVQRRGFLQPGVVRVERKSGFSSATRLQHGGRGPRVGPSSRLVSAQQHDELPTGLGQS